MAARSRPRLGAGPLALPVIPASEQERAQVGELAVQIAKGMQK